MINFTKSIKDIDFAQDILNLISKNTEDYQGLCDRAIEDLDELKRTLSNPELAELLAKNNKRTPRNPK